MAQFGRGVLADVSTKLLGQFVTNLETTVLAERQLGRPPTAAARAADAGSRRPAAPRRSASQPPPPATIGRLDDRRAAGSRPATPASRSTCSTPPAAPLAKRLAPLLAIVVDACVLLARRRRRCTRRRLRRAAVRRRRPTTTAPLVAAAARTRARRATSRSSCATPTAARRDPQRAAARRRHADAHPLLAGRPGRGRRRSSRLEAAGGVRRAEAEVDPVALADAHGRYAAERDAALPADWTGPRPSGGVGGTAPGRQVPARPLRLVPGRRRRPGRVAGWHDAAGGVAHGVSDGRRPVERRRANRRRRRHRHELDAASLGTDGRSRALSVRADAITRLGQGVDASGTLEPDAIERTLAVPARVPARLIDRHGVGPDRLSVSRHVGRRATPPTATSSSTAADDVLGVRPELLSGDEEAAPVLPGRHRRPRPGRRRRSWSSTSAAVRREFAYGSDRVRGGVSADIGCVRLTEKFLEHDPPRPEELVACLSVVEAYLDDVRARASPTSPRPAPSSAWPAPCPTVAAVELGLATYDRDRVHHFVLTGRRPRTCSARWPPSRWPTGSTTRASSPERADVIVGGCCALVAIMRLFGLERGPRGGGRHPRRRSLACAARPARSGRPTVRSGGPGYDPAPCRSPTACLMGPGPCNPYPEVQAAFARPMLGHLDPDFIAAARRDQRAPARRCSAPPTRSPSRERHRLGRHGGGVRQRRRPGDAGRHRRQRRVRRAHVRRRRPRAAPRSSGSRRRGASPSTPQALLDAHPSPAVIAVVHAETSTGVRNDVAPLGAGKGDALLLVDCVTSLGGIPVEIDGWGVDLAYSGTQKCLGVPPGLAPLTVDERALDAVRRPRRSRGTSTST